MSAGGKITDMVRCTAHLRCIGKRAVANDLTFFGAVRGEDSNVAALIGTPPDIAEAIVRAIHSTGNDRVLEWLRIMLHRADLDDYLERTVGHNEEELDKLLASIFADDNEREIVQQYTGKDLTATRPGEASNNG